MAPTTTKNAAAGPTTNANMNMNANTRSGSAIHAADDTVSSSFVHPAAYARDALMADYERKHSPPMGPTPTAGAFPAQTKEQAAESQTAARVARYRPANSFDRPREYLKKTLMSQWEASHSPIPELQND